MTNPFRRAILGAQQVSGTLVFDSFTAANGTLVTARPADSGQTWVAFNTDVFVIQGNEATVDTIFISDNHYIVIDAGASTVSLQVDVTLAPGGGNHALIVNFIDIDNYTFLTLLPSAASTPYVIGHIAGGIQSNYYTQANASAGSGNYELSVDGDIISAYKDGDLIYTGNIPNRPNKTATKCGIRARTTDGGSFAFYDNFTVSTI